MAVKALIFGTDDLYYKLKKFYDASVERGELEIVGYLNMNMGFPTLTPARGGTVRYLLPILQ